MVGGERESRGPSTRSSRRRQQQQQSSSSSSSSSSPPVSSGSSADAVSKLCSDAVEDLGSSSQEKALLYGMFGESGPGNPTTAMELDSAALEVMRDFGGSSTRSRGSDATSSSQQDLDSRRTPDSSDVNQKRAQNKGEKKRQLGEAMLERDDSSGASSRGGRTSLSTRSSSHASSSFSRSQTKAGGDGGGPSSSSSLVVSSEETTLRPPEDRRRAKNAREQRRAFKVVTHIDELAKILDEAGASPAAKASKTSVLTGISDYIEQLRSRNSSLETEQCEIVSKIVSVAAARDVDEKVDYRLVFLQSSVPMAVTSIDGKILACNERFVEGIGAESRTDLLSRTLFDLARPASLKHIFSCMSTLLCSEDDAPCGDVPNALKECQSTMTLTFIKDASAKNRVFTVSLSEQPLSSSSSSSSSASPNDNNDETGSMADLEKDLAVVENGQRAAQLAFIRQQHVANRAATKRTDDEDDEQENQQNALVPTHQRRDDQNADGDDGGQEQNRGDRAARPEFQVQIVG